MSEHTNQTKILNVYQILVYIILIMFIVEVCVMSILYFIPIQLGLVSEALIDGFLLAILSTPFIIFFVVQPFIVGRNRAYLKMEYDANHDSLTGLTNRRSIINRLEGIINSNLNTNKDKYVALYLFDIDDFKRVNDSLGHIYGDQLLIEISERLMSSLRYNDTVSRIDKNCNISRLGGDEFLIIVENLHNKDDYKIIANRLLNIFKSSFNISNIEIFVTASVGILCCSYNELQKYSNNVIFMKADIALYEAKRAGKNKFILYNDSIKSFSKHDLSMESRLNNSLSNNELFVVYQPYLNLNSCKITGVEVLIRWKTINKTLYPSQFIPVAETSGFIKQLGQWLIEIAFESFSRWRKAKYDIQSLSINVSIKQLDDDFILFINNKASLYNINPKDIVLEITETMLLNTDSEQKNIITELKNIGFGVSLDDFGTGYSSFHHLYLMPLTQLKIDKSFINNSTYCYNNKTQSILKSVVVMAKELGLSVIVEGVETKAEFDFIKSLNVDYIQGFYISKPFEENRLLKIIGRDFIE